jgi:ribosomal protein S18 acetylase RimI-like enzyme
LTTLSPLTPDEYADWLAVSIPAYARDKVDAGQWNEAESLAKSRAEVDEQLPQGMATPDHHFYAIRDAAETQSVGVLWIAAQTRGERRIAYVFDVWIRPAHRRGGHARRAFAALEDRVRELGLSGVSLHVFGHNAAARALYASLGYEPTNLILFKDVAIAPVRRQVRTTGSSLSAGSKPNTCA